MFTKWFSIENYEEATKVYLKQVNHANHANRGAIYWIKVYNIQIVFEYIIVINQEGEKNWTILLIS